MKKILSFILAALMTASCAAYVAADDAAVEATASNAAQDYAIEFLANYGIFKGYSAEDTGADDDIQRYQMALFVSRISTGWVDDAKWEDGTANNATFKDIEEGAAANYLGAISYANQNGIIEGYTANTFAPYDNITYRDALTMVVRTLGYKGLTYPWGYIQKAVELELTEGIGSDVAYTDNLTRGEVATIIYNAMFANTAKGTTLAKSIFDIDFKWQNIMIVGSDEYSVDSKAAIKAGYVAFRTIDAKSAELGDKIYYVKASELGLTGHEDELAVGTVFTALFEAVDGDFVTLVDSTSAKIASAFNDGITDNAGKAYETMPIANALADYELVKEYTKDYVNYYYNDLKVYGYQDYKLFEVAGKNECIGIDHSTGDILQKNADGKWEIAWYYNSKLDKYYRLQVTADGKTIDINWMSDAEFIEWYNNGLEKVIAQYKTLQLLKDAGGAMLKGVAPYAKLDLFDIDNDGVAEIANYKDYRIGMFSTTTKKCASCNADKPAYKLTDLDGGNEKVIFVEDGHTNHDTDKEHGFAWVNVDPSVTTFKNEDGSFVGGVVLYNLNEATGEIEIVKHIIAGEGDDADSYITTGILQAYNTANKTVTINGVTYPIAYTNLDGDIYHMKDANALVNRTRVGQILDEQYMQYVSAVVCDGYVVDTDLVGSDTDFIVVLGYAGITSDGYIAVYGYSTDDVAMKVFKINSFNGWKKGDYRYYPTNANEDAAFDLGTLYQIKSYDAETQSYGVYTENVSSALAKAKPVKITFEDGYRIVEPMTITYDRAADEFTYTAKEGATAEVTKMDDKDYYVVVTNATESTVGFKSNVFTYSGIVKKNTVQTPFYGLLVDTGVAKKFVIYSTYTDALTNEALPFFANNSYEIGYVLYEKANGTVLNAAYDDAIAGDYYLLGSTQSEVRVMNLLTGNRDYAFTSNNIDLLNGHIYKTIGNHIIADITDECTSMHNFVETIADAYGASIYDLDYATYVVKMHDNDGLKGSELFDTLALAKFMGFVNGSESYAAVKAAELVKGVTLYVVGEDGFDWYADGYHGGSFVTPLTKDTVKADYTYYVDFIYEVSSGKLVGYVYDIADKAEGIEEVTVKKFENDTAELPALFYELDTIDGRTFGLKTTYEASVAFDNEDCLGDIIANSFKLNSVTLEVVEKVDGEWVSLKDCATDSAMHNVLAHYGFGIGVAGMDEKIEVKVDDARFVVKAADVTEYCMACGLGYKLEIKNLNNYDNVMSHTGKDEANSNAVFINDVAVSSFTLGAVYYVTPVADPDATAEAEHGSTFKEIVQGNYSASIYDTELNLNVEKADVVADIIVAG